MHHFRSQSMGWCLRIISFFFYVIGSILRDMPKVVPALSNTVPWVVYVLPHAIPLIRWHLTMYSIGRIGPMPSWYWPPRAMPSPQSPTVLNSVLCIFTSKQVLRTPFAGQNHIFGCFSMFSYLLPSQIQKRRKICKKLRENTQKGVLPAFRCYSSI